MTLFRENRPEAMKTAATRHWRGKVGKEPNFHFQEWSCHLLHSPWQLVPGASGLLVVRSLAQATLHSRLPTAFAPTLPSISRVWQHTGQQWSVGSAGRQTANPPCQCQEGLGHDRPGEHCGSALLPAPEPLEAPQCLPVGSTHAGGGEAERL